IKSGLKNDQGIAAQSILLGAVDKGLGGCIIGSIKRELLREMLNIDPMLEILLVIALGKPKEQVVIEKMNQDDNIKYWRDENGIHHVPKRNLDDLIVG
nr:nitroreductase family protein [Bacteroidota bacterium]